MIEKNEIKSISVQGLKNLMDRNGDAQLVDVREAPEYEGEHLVSFLNMPLSTLGEECHDLKKDSPVYLLCRTGNRALQAARQLKSRGAEQVCIVEGGLEGWKREGYSIQKGKASVWSLERQVRFSAGLLVLLGIVLGWLVHKAFLGISIFVAGGLVFSALTDTCGMGLLLAKMPWNRR